MEEPQKSLECSKSRIEEQLFHVIGDFGPWQRRVFLITFLVNIMGAWQNFSVTFLAPNLDYWCVSPRMDNVSSLLESSEGIMNNVSSLLEFSEVITGNTSESKTNQCMVSLYGNNTNECSNCVTKVPCNEWEYNLTYYTSTIVSEWNLVCEKEWLISFAKSVYMFGFFVSVFVFGQISDCIGRFPAIMMCYVITFISSALSPFSTSYTMFVVLRFFQALGRSGLCVIAFVLLMEIIGPKWRTQMAVAFQVGFSIGFITLPMIAWLVRSWFWFLIVIALPHLPLISLYWLVPESPRWLLARKKRGQFEKVVANACRLNGREMKLDAKQLLQSIDDKPTKANTFVDILKSSNMRKHTLNMMLAWMVNSFVYYSLSYNTNDLGGDPYINFILSGFIEVVSYVILYFVVLKLKRRPSVVGGMVMGGVACAASIVVPSHLNWLSITCSMIGKLFINGTFALLYIYTSEMFPTVVRNVALGSCSTSARVGSIVAPFVRELGKASHPAVPNALNSAFAIISGLLALFFPETKDRDIPDTIRDIERDR